MNKCFTILLLALTIAACGVEPAVFGTPADDDDAGGASTTAGPGGQGGGQGGASTSTTGPGGQGGGGCDGPDVCDGDLIVTCDGELVEDCAASNSSCVAAACETALRLLLRFNEGGGGSLHDDAQGLTGQLYAPTGQVGWSPGVEGYALDIAPTAEADFGDVLNDLSFPVSIAAWVYVDPAAQYNMVLVATDSSPGTNYAGFWLSVDPDADNAVSAGFGNGSGTGPSSRHGIKTLGGFPVATWTHVAATIYGYQSATVWIDGVEAPGSYSGSATSVAFTTNGHLRVGRAPWGQGDLPFNGAVDELRIYDRALTAAEVAALATK